MGAKTDIEWTDATWNPVRGCSRVSPGCENCYAERMAARFSGPGEPYAGLARMGKNGPRWTGKVRLVEEHLGDPLRWKKPRRVFVNSMSDLFHERLSNEDIAAVFGVMAAAPQHQFQVLTKRADRMAMWFRWVDKEARRDGNDGRWHVVEQAAYEHLPNMTAAATNRAWPLSNVWLGVSVEDQEHALERIPLLLQAPAAVRFLSVEPLLGPVDLSWLFGLKPGAVWQECVCKEIRKRDRPCITCSARHALGAECGVHWVIAGAESGPGARPMQESWVRDLRRECEGAAVPFFYKQRLDERGRKVSLPLLDGRASSEMPRGGQ